MSTQIIVQAVQTPAGTFRCRCGAHSLIHGGNVVVRLPGGQSVRLCGHGCPEKAAVRREADEAWDRFQKAQPHRGMRHTGETAKNGGRTASLARKAEKRLRDKELRAQMRGGSGGKGR